MKRFIKAISFTLSVITIISSLCLSSCNAQKKIALTTENIREYLSIECEVLDFEIKEEVYYLYGIKVKDYDGSYGMGELVINKKSKDLEFQDVKITVKLSVSADSPYPWEFKTGNVVEKHEKYDMYYNCKYVDCTIPYDGEYFYGVDLVIGRNENRQSLLDASDLRHIKVEIVAVEGYVTKE